MQSGAQPGQAGYGEWAQRTGEEKVLAGICHLSYVLFIFPVIIPLIVWLVKGRSSRYIGFHAMQCLLAHLAPTVFVIVGIITAVLLIGIPILAASIVAYAVLWFVELAGTIVCFGGGEFRIPLCAAWADEIVK